MMALALTFAPCLRLVSPSRRYDGAVSPAGGTIGKEPGDLQLIKKEAMMALLTVADANEATARLLHRYGIVPPHVLQVLQGRAEQRHVWLGELAVQDGLVTEQELAQCLAEEQGLEFIAPHVVHTPDARTMAVLPREMCERHLLVPLAMHFDTLDVAIANPFDETAIRQITERTSLNIVRHIVTISTVRAIIAEHAAAAPTPSTKTVALNDAAALADIEPDIDSLHIDELLVMMVRHHASDLHITVGSPPLMRIDGELQPMPYPMLTPQATQNLLYTILMDEQVHFFERHRELDFAYSLPDVSRFRVNVFRQRGSVAAVLRVIPTEIPDLDSLKMPPIVRDLTRRPRGLVLVTGPTGSGKSTTLAAMINEINITRRSHIVTVEDPIEFLHRHRLSEINQREVGADTESFADALRHVLRQDPDVIFIGELRDLETIATAVTAAETGHLVFATLHTTSAAQTIDRIIDAFPPHQQEQVRSQLSNVLEAVITQTLVPKSEGEGRCCAMEILIATSAVRNLIREGKIHMIGSVLQSSAKCGMQTLDSSLRDLVVAGKVTREDAMLKAVDPEQLQRLIELESTTRTAS